MKINELFGNSRIDWTALRTAGAVQPMLYYPGGKDPETGRIIPPNVNQPNIITAVNLKQKLGPGEKLVPLSTRSMTDDQWQKYMDDWWTKNKNDPDAKNKIDQIKQSAREKNVEFNEWMIMPQTIEPQGLIHLPGRGPNNRFDFKNKGNNRANEQEDQKINYKSTIDTDEEWKEAGYIDPKTKQPRYPQLAKLGPGGFAALVNRGRNTKITRPENIKNTTATSVQQAKREFPNLRPSARANFKSQIQQGEVERPIVVRFGPGDTNDVLIGGNTRFTGLMAMGIQPEVKFIDLSNQQETLEAKFDEYFTNPRTLGEPGYGKAHPLHPDNVKPLADRFKEKFKSFFNKKKEEPKREWTAFEMACMEGGHPLPEETINEKCWDGYRQAGMKNKGGRQVPNCVPEEAAGVGTITKQNTTVDVKPGETQRQAAKFGFKLDKKGLPPKLREMWTEWQEFKENFADGKKKGKSRPGRVKRAGASCKGSVASLRSKAKRYGGERGRMYHWCANMKSGRKKSR